MTATLKDIAMHLNLDKSTVSRVLNGRDNRVSQEKREQIVSTARELGYVPNRNARSLINGKTCTIGILVQNVSNGIYAEYLELIEKYLQPHKYNIRPFIYHNRAEKEAAFLESLKNREIDGMIGLHYNIKNADCYLDARENGGNIVFRCGPEIGEMPFDSVRVDIIQGYKNLCSHLIEEGCRKIAILGGDLADDIKNSRTTIASKAFSTPCALHGIEMKPEYGITCEDSQEAAFKALCTVLEEKGRFFDGLIVHNTNKVFGAIKALKTMSFRIPDDVKICTVTDLDLCRMATEPVTVWNQPVDDICKSLVELIMSRIENPSQPLRKVEYSSELIIRKSSRTNPEKRQI